jgi:hypothetical protein
MLYLGFFLRPPPQFGLFEEGWTASFGVVIVAFTVSAPGIRRAGVGAGKLDDDPGPGG